MVLTTRITVALVAVVSCTALAVGTLSYRGVERLVIPNELDRLRNGTERAADSLVRYVRGARADVLVLADDPLVSELATASATPTSPAGPARDALVERLARRFVRQLQANPNYLQLRLLGGAAEGIEILRVDRRRAGAPVRQTPTAELQRKGDRPYYQRALEAQPGDAHVSRIELNREHGQVEAPEVPVLRIAAPIVTADGAPLGAVVLNIDMAPAFVTLTSEFSVSGRTYVLNTDGDLLVHPDDDVTFAFERGAPKRWPDVLPGLAPVLDAGMAPTAALVELDGETYGAATATATLAQGPSVRVVRTLGIDSLRAPLASIRRDAISGAALSLVLAIGCSLLLARTLTRPLRRVTRAVSGFEAGDLVRLPEIANGEIGALARALETMSAHLRERMEEGRRLSEQLRQAQKMEAIGQFAGGIAHDFNNLLMVVIGYTDAALEDLSRTNPARESLEHVLRAANSASALTRQLLAFSRRQVLKPEVLDVNRVLQSTRGLLARLIREDIDLTTLPEVELEPVRADPSQLEQILINLAVNARDAMPGGGRLTIETRSVELDDTHVREHPDATTGRHVMIAVTATGIGMTPEQMERIFDPFYTTKGLGRGTGLGLATVYGIVKQSRGHIRVDSKPGSGTRFEIYLPCVSDRATSARQATPVRRAPSMRRGAETILVAEDDTELRQLLSRALRHQGYTVLEVADGEEAIDCSRRHRGVIHMLLTDVVLPKQNAWELADKIVSQRPEIAVVYMSGYTDDAVIHDRLLDSDAHFLQKPIPPRVLLERIRSILDEE